MKRFKLKSASFGTLLFSGNLKRDCLNQKNIDGLRGYGGGFKGTWKRVQGDMEDRGNGLRGY